MATQVVGKAIYLELERSLGTRTLIDQVIILPSYKANSGHSFPVITMDRTLDEYSPKAQWDFNFQRGGMNTDWRTNNQVSTRRTMFGRAGGEDESIREPMVTTLPSHLADDSDEEIQKQITTYRNVDRADEADKLAKSLAWERSLSKEELAKAQASTLELKFLRSITMRDSDHNISFDSKLRSPLTKPIVVEVTDEDMEKAVSHSTPQALIRRIQKVRVAKGLPEKVIVVS